ncbi:MAG: hypothetical protein LOD90_04450 [Symbiobacteriaceae bacterium]
MLTDHGLPAHLVREVLLSWPALAGAIAMVSGCAALWGVGRQPVLLTLRGE